MFVNTFCAAARIAYVQLLRGRRAFVTAAVFVLPAAIAALLVWFSHMPKHSSITSEEIYIAVTTGMLATVLVPFLGLFWGSALINDEIEGRTLVYLWTRPSGRVLVFWYKFIMMIVLFAIFSACSLALEYAVSFYSEGTSAVVSNLRMVFWDSLAFVLAGAAYAGLGFLLACFFRNPLGIGLIYVFGAESFTALLPGYLKLFSIRHYLYVLSSHPKTDAPKGFLKFLGESDTTETQAIVTLICLAVVFLIAGGVVLKLKEFSRADTTGTQ